MAKYRNQTHHIVLRSTGERTEHLCLAIMKSLKTINRVTLINEAPFESALRRSYELGIETKADWTITIDADTVVSPELLLAALEKLPRLSDHNTFQIQPHIIDFLSGTIRLAGIRFYQTRHLETAINLIDPPGRHMRPEREVVRKMEQRGLPSAILPDVVAVHDYFQFFRDVYRTSYSHGVKFASVAHNLVAHWQTQIRSEPDFRVAILGIADGLAWGTNVQTDAACYPNADEALAKLDLVEKAPLQESDISGEQITRLILNHTKLRTHLERCGTKGQRTVNKLKNRVQETGYLKFAPWASGHLLETVGKTLKHLSNNSTRKL